MKLTILLIMTSSLISGIGVASAYHQELTVALLSPMLVGVFNHFLNNHHKFKIKRKHRKTRRKRNNFLKILKPLLQIITSFMG